MLHAFARNKSKAFTRYLGVRNPAEPRVSSEDEITSILFGPHEFLSASDNWALWRLLLQSHGSHTVSGALPPDYFDHFAPSACTFEFWPRKNNIEPDLLIRFSDGQGRTRSLLVELKWDAGPSGADQLEKQWLRYQGSEHDSSLHVFIAKRLDLPDDMRPWAWQGSGGLEGRRLRALRWHEFQHQIVKLAGLPGTSGPLGRWCTLASSFLNQVGIRPFVGFHASVRMAEACPDAAEGAPAFWPRQPA